MENSTLTDNFSVLKKVPRLRSVTQGFKPSLNAQSDSIRRKRCYWPTVERAAKTCYLSCMLLQNELKSDVLRFTTNESNLSCNESACCRFWAVVAESREPANVRCATKSVRVVRFYRPKADLFCNKWCNSHVWLDSHVILSNQKSIFTQLATTWFAAKQVWTWPVNSQHSFSTLQQCCKTSCTFYRPLLP